MPITNPPVPDADLASSRRNNGAKPTAALRETFPRILNISNAAVALTSARLRFTPIWLDAGLTLTGAAFISGGTALSAGTNQWFALYTTGLAKLRVTTDDTSTAWGTNALKSLAFSSTYNVTTSGIYLLGICVVASTPPTLAGMTTIGSSSANDQVPKYSGGSTTGLTDPASAPDPAAAISGQGGDAYAWVY